MGSRSKSRTTTNTSSVNTTTDVTNTSADNRVTDTGNIGGNVSVGQSEGNLNITTTDFGAIDAAFDGILDAQDSAFEVGNAAIAANQDVVNTAFAAQSATFDATLDSIDDNNALNNQLVLQALDYNQALIGESNRSEGATFSNKLIENIMPLALVVGGVLLLRGAK